MTRETRLLLAILLLAVALRLLIAFHLGDSVPPNKDETSYHTLAAQVADGRGFTFPTGWYPFTSPETPTAHWSFLYTGFLAGLYALAGAHPLAGRLAGAALGGALLPWLTWRLARAVLVTGRGQWIEAPAQPSAAPFHSAIPLTAAALAAVYGYFILFAAQLMTETFFICALQWSLERSIALARGLALDRKAKRIAIALGIALAAATLIRQSILPWVALSSVWLLWQAWRARRVRAGLAAVTLVAAIIAAVVLPFTLRNLRAYDGRFLLLNSNAGYAMYSAQHPGHGTAFREYWAAPLPSDLDGRGLNEAQWDAALMRRGIGFIFAAPGRYLLLSLSRVRDYFEFWPTTDSSLLFNLGRVLSIGVLLPFMMAGVALSLTRRGRSIFDIDASAHLVMFMASYSLLHILTWAMSRYRLPVDAVALPFAALCLTLIWDAAARRAAVPATRADPQDSRVSGEA